MVRWLLLAGLLLSLVGLFILSPLAGGVVCFGGILCWLGAALVVIDRLGAFLESDMPLTEKLGFEGGWMNIPTVLTSASRSEREEAEQNVRSKWWQCPVCDTWNKIAEEECIHCGEEHMEY